MSFRDLIESAIKGDAVSFNETFNKVMGEAAVEAVDEINNPVELEDVIETLLTLGVLSEEDLESEDFTEETLLELSKKLLGRYVKDAAREVKYAAREGGRNAEGKKIPFPGSPQAKAANKRLKGIDKATDKLTGSAKVNAKD